jgi:hypothetical protein
MLGAAGADDPSIKPAVRANLLASVDYVDAMRRLVPVNVDPPLSLWAGERDDAELHRMADEFAIRGPIQRLLAALDSAGAR